MHIWALPGVAGRTRVSHLHVRHCMRPAPFQPQSAETEGVTREGVDQEARHEVMGYFISTW